MAERVSLVVNGQEKTVDVEPRRILFQVLREDLGLTGTHVGCDTSQCGACTVLVDGAAVKSCTSLRSRPMAAQRDDHRRARPERGPAPASSTAFWEKHGLQCGFCTPGMIVTAADLLAP